MNALLLALSLTFSATFSYAMTQKPTSLKARTVAAAPKGVSVVIKRPKATLNPGRTDLSTCDYTAKKATSPFTRDGKYTLADASRANKPQVNDAKVGTF